MTYAIPQPAGGVRLETFVPLTLVKCGAKKQVVGPDGAPEAVRVAAVERAREADGETPALRALGLAHYWQHLLDTGRVGSLTDIAAAEDMDLGQVSRIARLAWQSRRREMTKRRSAVRPTGHSFTDALMKIATNFSLEIS